MISAFLNSVKIPELRRRILFTLAVIVIVRLGAAITTPGVNQGVLQEWFRSSLSQRTGGGLAALFNLFSGGAVSATASLYYSREGLLRGCRLRWCRPGRLLFHRGKERAR